MKYQSVLFASMKLHNIKDFPPSPTRTQETSSFFFFSYPLSLACLSRLSVAQKAKASNDTRY